MIKVIQIIAFLIASVLCAVIECEGNAKLNSEREPNYLGKVGYGQRPTFRPRIQWPGGL